MDNPCINCGKQRIDGKSWKEKNGNSVIIHTQTICPDSECQKQVDRAVAEKREKSALLAKERLEGKLARDKLLVAT